MSEWNGRQKRGPYHKNNNATKSKIDACGSDGREYKDTEGRIRAEFLDHLRAFVERHGPVDGQDFDLVEFKDLVGYASVGKKVILYVKLTFTKRGNIDGNSMNMTILVSCFLVSP